MSQDTLERIVEDVKTLTSQEQQHLRTLLDQNLAKPPEETLVQQQLLLERLLEKGIIEKIPSGLYGEEARDFHAPIDVIGNPLSEILLDDRE